MDFKDLLESIIQISTKAGDKIIDIYNLPSNSLKVDYKSDSSPLTIDDKASNKIIISGLKKLNQNIPILSEEEKEVNFKLRKKWDIFWLVDPLDGTKEFIKRNGEFTVNIALIKDGNPIMGVVYAPVLKKTWYGLDKWFEINSSKFNNNAICYSAKDPVDSYQIILESELVLFSNSRLIVFSFCFTDFLRTF